MEYRLLISLEAVRELDALPRKVKERLLRLLERVRRAPDHSSDFARRGPAGERLEISVRDHFAITYQIDFPVREVKVIAISPADR